MKKIILILLFAGLLRPLSADDLIKNGDFSEGTTHWSGHFMKDGDSGSSLDGGVPSLTSTTSSNTGGLKLKLTHDWTELSQDITWSTRFVEIEIVYSVSDDISFSADPDDYKEKYNFKPGTWLVIQNDFDSHQMVGVVPIIPKLDSGAIQTVVRRTCHIGKSERSTLDFAFPPGHGILTIHKISIVPAPDTDNH